MATLLGPLHKAETQLWPVVVDTLIWMLCRGCLKHFWSGGCGITNSFLHSADTSEASYLLSPGPHMADEKVVGGEQGADMQ